MLTFLILVNTDENKSRLYNINSLLTQEEKEEIFKTHIALVSNINEFKKVFREQKPDILLLDMVFETNMKIKFLKEFRKLNRNDCKLIMTFKDKAEREELEKDRIPHRFFSYKVSNNVIYKALLEMNNPEILSNTHNNNDIDNFIKLLNLDINSPSTRQFVFALRIVLNESSQYLFWGMFYNVVYSVSRIEQVSTQTIRKNLSVIKEQISKHTSAELCEEIFKDNNIFSLNSSDILELCVNYLKNERQ